MAVETYDSAQVNVIIGGNIVTDVPDGDFLTITRDEDSFTKNVGARGEVSRSRTNNKSGEAELLLKQTSPTNAILTALHNADVLNGDGVVPFLVVDKSTGETHFAGESWIKKLPDPAYAKEEGNRAYMFDLASIDSTYVPVP